MTLAGETLFERAQALLTMADSVKQSVAEISDLRAGRLTVAFIPSLGVRWLPEILRDFRISFQNKLLARQGVPSVLGDPVRIVDENMRDVRRDGGTVGEVVMRGATVMKGYYKEPEATARGFRGGWFHTGDLAVMHPDGYIELRDRLLDSIVVGGEKVSSNEIEQTLSLHEQAPKPKR